MAGGVRNYLSDPYVPYDEEQSMPVPDEAITNSFLNARLGPRLPNGINRLLNDRGYPGMGYPGGGGSPQMSASPVNMLAQEPRISEYDMYGLYHGGNSAARGYRGMDEASPVNRFLNQRLGDRMSRGSLSPAPGPQMSLQEFMVKYGRGPATDSEIMMVYDFR
jgi:hypothetical protein